MLGVTLVSVFVVLFVLGAVALHVVRATWPIPSLADGPPSRTRPRDPAARSRWAGILAGLAAAALAVRFDELGRGLLLAAPVFGLCVLGGTLAGELHRQRPGGEIRRASLRVRRLTDYLPPVLGSVVAGSAVALFGLAALTTATGSSDDLRRAGREVSCAWEGGTASAGPWPGLYYTVPMLSVVVAGLLTAAVVLHRIVRRPQPAGLGDDAARRRSGEVVTAAAGMLVLVPLAGMAITSSWALDALTPVCTAAWWSGSFLALQGTGGAAFGAACWCGAVLLGGKR